MTRTLGDRISDYRNDPYFPTSLLRSVFYGTVDWVWFKPDGKPRRYKPSNFDNPVSRWVNRRLFTAIRERNLTLLERVLLNLGF